MSSSNFTEEAETAGAFPSNFTNETAVDAGNATVEVSSLSQLFALSQDLDYHLMQDRIFTFALLPYNYLMELEL